MEMFQKRILYLSTKCLPMKLVSAGDSCQMNQVTKPALAIHSCFTWLSACMSLDLPQISRPALSCWPAGSLPPPHLFTSSPSGHRMRCEMASRCSSSARAFWCSAEHPGPSLCHITAVASSALCHPDAGPLITSGDRFPGIMALSTKGCFLRRNTGESKARSQFLGGFKLLHKTL